ncbi:hypothetical protein Fmac_008677 [Flemingia macrophylla]|uniref:ABC transporter domain-containing protein n=1 Tax=Flemingia macrophylla TaxID=520843 RepID=A0ABD1MY21_9FABA
MMSSLAMELSHISGFHLTSNLGKYLRIPLIHGRKHRATYQHILDKRNGTWIQRSRPLQQSLDYEDWVCFCKDAWLPSRVILWEAYYETFIQTARDIPIAKLVWKEIYHQLLPVFSASHNLYNWMNNNLKEDWTKVNTDASVRPGFSHASCEGNSYYVGDSLSERSYTRLGEGIMVANFIASLALHFLLGLHLSSPPTRFLLLHSLCLVFFYTVSLWCFARGFDAYRPCIFLCLSVLWFVLVDLFSCMAVNVVACGVCFGLWLGNSCVLLAVEAPILLFLFLFFLVYLWFFLYVLSWLLFPSVVDFGDFSGLRWQWFFCCVILRKVKKKMDESLSKEDIRRKEKDGRVVRKLEERLGDILAGTSQFLGYPKKQETFARVSGYCEQNDIHSPHVTVYESLLYSAWLRLSGEINSKTTKLGVIGLSTEQRKILTIVVVVVANPSIILMDEPTFGLHARAADVVMRAVRNIVDTGRIVVCTIHQPNIDIFESYDEAFRLRRAILPFSVVFVDVDI